MVLKFLLLIIVISNGFLLLVWYYFFNRDSVSTAKWNTVYNITKSPMENFIGTDMSRIFRQCDYLYHQVDVFRTIGSLKLKEEKEQRYMGYNGSEVWNEMVRKCKKSSGINAEFLLGYRAMIDMQIGTNYDGVLNLPFLMKRLFNDFEKIYSMILFYQKLIVSFAQTRNIFFEGRELKSDLSYFFSNTNLTQSQTFINLIKSSYDIERLLTVANGINKFLLLFSNKKITDITSSTNSTIDDKCLDVLTKYASTIKNKDIRHFTKLDVKGMKVMNKINSQDSTDKITKKEYITFLYFFQRFSKNVIYLKIIDTVMKKGKSNRTKTTVLINLMFFMVFFFLNYYYYKVLTAKPQRVKKHKN